MSAKTIIPDPPLDKTVLEQFKLVLEKDETALYGMKTDENLRSCKRQTSLAFTKIQEVRFWIDEAIKRIDKVNTIGYTINERSKKVLTKNKT